MFIELYVDFSRRLRAGHPIVSGAIWLKFEFVQAFMKVLVPCKNEESNKNKGASVHNISPVVSL